MSPPAAGGERSAQLPPPLVEIPSPTATDSPEATDETSAAGGQRLPSAELREILQRLEALERGAAPDAAEAAAAGEEQGEAAAGAAKKAASGSASPSGDKSPTQPASGQGGKSDATSSSGKEKAAAASSADWVDLSNEKWTVKLGGHVQMDYIVWPDADPAIVGADNYFSYRRLRLVADGTGYGQYDFRLQLTLEPGEGPASDISATAEVKDAYLSMNDVPLFGRLRAGNFFVPFGLEQVTNDTMNVFLERSIPTQGIFTADREVGVAAYNCNLDQNVTWSGGVFFEDVNDTAKTRRDDNQGTRIAGRLTCLPYYDAPSQGRYLLHLGAGALYTHDRDDRIRFRARPQVQRGPVLLDTQTLDAETSLIGNVELAMVCGRLTVQSEAYLCGVDTLAGPHAELGGAYVHASWFLTGENRNYERFGQHGAQFGRPTAFTNFFATPAGMGSGAWEFKTRWSNLNFRDVNAGEYNDLTVGFNWYMTERARWMFDWIHPVTTGNAVFGRTASDLIGMRLDFNW